MATLDNLYSVIQPSGPFAGRLQAAMVKVSWDVYQEDETTENHTNRLLLAQHLLVDVRGVCEKYYRFIIGHPVLQAEIEDLQNVSDSNILSVVTDLWNIMANVEATDGSS